MAAVRQLGRDAGFLRRHFAKHRHVAQLRKMNRHAERRRRRPPPSRPDQHRLSALERLVDPADQPGDRVFALLGQREIAVRPHEYDMVDRQPDVAAHEAAAGREETIVRRLGQFDRPPEAARLQRPALQQVDAVRSVRREVDRELDVDGVLVHGGELRQHLPHERRKIGPLQQPAEIDDIRRRPVCQPELAHARGRFVIRRGDERSVGLDAAREHDVRIPRDQRALPERQQVDFMLHVFAPVAGMHRRLALRVIQADDPRVVAFGPVDRPRPEPEHEPQHARVHVDAFLPHVQVRRMADARRMREIAVPVLVSGHPLHEQRHLLVLARQPADLPIDKRVLVHRAGVDGPHRLLERFIPLFRRPPVDAEDALVFAGERVPVLVFQERAGADDDRGLAVMLEHPHEPLPDVVGEPARQQFLPELGRAAEIALLRLLPHEQLPPAVVNDVRIEHVRADVPGIVRLQPRREPVSSRRLQNAPGEQHADALAADEAAADLALRDPEDVRERKVAAAQLQQARFAAGEHLEQPHLDPLLLTGRRIQRLLRLREHDVPVVQPVLAARDRGEQFGRFGARGDADGFVAVDPVREEHDGGVAVPGFQRMDVVAAAGPVHVDQHLRRLADARNRRKGVGVTNNGEVGDGFEFVEIRTGDAEEVADHQVGMPVGEQIGEAVEHVERPPAFPLDQPVDGRGEAFESPVSPELDDDGVRIRRKQRLVAAETDVDQFPSVPLRLPGEPRGQSPVLPDLVDLPHDVVAEPQPVDDVVDSPDAGADAVVHHAGTPQYIIIDNKQLYFHKWRSSHSEPESMLLD